MNKIKKDLRNTKEIMMKERVTERKNQNKRIKEKQTERNKDKKKKKEVTYKIIKGTKVLYLTVCQSGMDRLGESHLCKTMAGAVTSITNIYSLV